MVKQHFPHKPAHLFVRTPVHPFARPFVHAQSRRYLSNAGFVFRIVRTTQEWYRQTLADAGFVVQLPVIRIERIKTLSYEDRMLLLQDCSDLISEINDLIHPENPEIMEVDVAHMTLAQRTNRLRYLIAIVMEERQRLGIQVPEDDITHTMEFTEASVAEMSNLEISELMNILSDLLDEYAQLP